MCKISLSTPLRVLDSRDKHVLMIIMVIKRQRWPCIIKIKWFLRHNLAIHNIMTEPSQDAPSPQRTTISLMSEMKRRDEEFNHFMTLNSLYVKTKKYFCFSVVSLLILNHIACAEPQNNFNSISQQKITQTQWRKSSPGRNTLLFALLRNFCYARPKYLTKINLNLIIYIVCWLAPASVRWKKVETDRPIALQVYNSQILPSSDFWIEKLELLRLSLVCSALSCRLNPSFSTSTRPECLLIDFMKLSSNSRQRITIKLI